MTDTDKKIAFILEMEKLKAVLRKTRPVGLARYENTAEHSWQTTLAALLFMPEGLDALRVLKMLLIHDIVEIDAGDVFVYDEVARQQAEAVEREAAERLFGMLPEPLASEFHSLWIEFEERASPEAVYAKALDRVCPVVQNINSNPSSWTDYAITEPQALAKNTEIGNANAELWAVLRSGIENAGLPKG
ncbi:HD family hydrolase [Pseudahrensia aquimaris]|uniref:HD family hydrolase n=1 Tax=Pseudahrensia aquimaris TaxID=744461 RepID=A0ABW3FI74_9HYPH